MKRGSGGVVAGSKRGTGTAGAKVRFGPAGWMYKDWEGIVYPGAGVTGPPGVLKTYGEVLGGRPSLATP